MSSTSVASAAKCTIAIQKKWDTNNAPAKRVGGIGGFEALYSQANRQNFEQIAEGSWGRGAPASGQECSIQIRYVQPVCATPATSGGICADPPDQTSPFGRMNFYFTSTDNNVFVAELPETLLHCNSDTELEIVAATIDQHANALLKAIDRKLIDGMLVGMGKYTNSIGGAGAVSTVTPITLNIFTANGNAIQPAGWTPAIMQMDAAGANGRPIVVGGSRLKAYVDSASLAGVVNNGVTNVLPFDFYYSSNYDAAATSAGLNPLSCMVFAPGVFQAVEYYDNVSSQYNTRGRNVSDTHTRVVLNKTTDYGLTIPFDWEIFYKEDCHSYKWALKKTVGLFSPPETQCAGGDVKLFFELGCGDATCPVLPAA